MRWRPAIRLALACFVWSSVSHALCAKPWDRLPEAGREVVRPLPLALIGGAVIPPLVMIPTGADHDLRVVAQSDLGGTYYPEPVSIWAPYVLVGATAATYVGGAVAKNCAVQRQTSAIMQGVTATGLVVGLTKFITGRTWPIADRDPYAADRLEYPEDSKEFRPFTRGIDAAFPSGHTAIMFSAAAAFRASSPRGVWWRFLGYPLAGGVGFAMWYGDHHWASEILSGLLIGEALGGAAGRAWAPEDESKSDAEDARGTLQIEWALIPTPGGGALSVDGRF